MTAICFVCNLPIMSHQVGLVWQGGNGWDDLVREQVRMRNAFREFWDLTFSFIRSKSPPYGNDLVDEGIQLRRSVVQHLLVPHRRLVRSQVHLSFSDS